MTKRRDQMTPEEQTAIDARLATPAYGICTWEKLKELWMNKNFVGFHERIDHEAAFDTFRAARS